MSVVLAFLMLLAPSQESTPELALRGAIQENPQDLKPYLELSEYYRSRNQLDEAFGILREAQGRFSQDPDVLYRLGVVLAERGDVRTALEHLNAVPGESAPDGYWKALGRTLLTLGQLDRAESAFLTHLQAYPASVSTVRILTGIAMKQEDIPKAWQYIQKARELAPASPQVLFEYARIGLSSGHVGDALMTLQMLLLMDPGNPDYLLGLGNAFLSTRDAPLAESYLKQYVEKRPEDPVGHATLGYACYLYNRYDEAYHHLQTALQMDANLTQAQLYQGLIAYKRADDQTALGMLRKVLEKSPRNGEARLFLGKVYIRQQRYPEALAELTQAIYLIPENSDLHFQLSRVYSQLGNTEEAQRELELYNRYRQREIDATSDSLRPTAERH